MALGENGSDPIKEGEEPGGRTDVKRTDKERELLALCDSWRDEVGAKTRVMLGLAGINPDDFKRRHEGRGRQFLTH